ncbi:unnamed protein product, partial [Discosporangium mesarthrocarpum]
MELPSGGGSERSPASTRGPEASERGEGREEAGRFSEDPVHDWNLGSSNRLSRTSGSAGEGQGGFDSLNIPKERERTLGQVGRALLRCSSEGGHVTPSPAPAMLAPFVM